ncbi:MAG: LrgB family protein [Marinifilaceae bacterium]|jgi:putative effector of murein hydrolase|nr:LrgB family protein [Marinifilaceae bacterium]
MIIKLAFIILTLLVWFVSKFLCNKIFINVLPPIVLCIAIIYFGLDLFDYETSRFKENIDFINSLLGPATVMLAIPLYKEIQNLKKYFKQILIGISFSASLSISLTYILAGIFHLSDKLTKSFLPHSVTTPIGIDISEILGGVQPITVASIIFSGILGALISVPIFKLMSIKSPIARGLAIGSTSHAVGTSKALELGQTEGALSSLAIPLTAIYTAFICVLIRILIY